MFCGHQEIFMVRYLVVTKRFSRWDISWSSRDSLGGLNSCSWPSPLICSLMISWWSLHVLWSPGDFHGEISRGHQDILLVFLNFVQSHNLEVKYTCFLVTKRFSQWDISGSPRDSLGVLPPPLVNKWKNICIPIHFYYPQFYWFGFVLVSIYILRPLQT